MESNKTDAKAKIFINLANRRVNRVIRNINEIAKLSDKSHYYYTDDQVQQITQSLKNEINALKLTFKKNKISRNKFNLM